MDIFTVYAKQVVLKGTNGMFLCCPVYQVRIILHRQDVNTLGYILLHVALGTYIHTRYVTEVLFLCTNRLDKISNEIFVLCISLIFFVFTLYSPRLEYTNMFYYRVPRVEYVLTFRLFRCVQPSMYIFITLQ